MRRYIKYAKLQGTDAFVPGIGGLGTTLPVVNKSFKTFSMYIDSEFPNFMTVEMNTTVALVPLTNIQIAVFTETPSTGSTLSVVPMPAQSLAV